MQKKKLTKKTVLILTASVFLIIAMIIAGASLFLQRYEDKDPIIHKDNESLTSFNEHMSDPDETDDPIGDASQTFAESFPEISDVSDDISLNEAESSTEENKNESEPEIKHGWVINEYGYTYLYGNCGYEQFNYKSTALERYSASLNSFASLIGPSCRLFNITVPVSSTFAPIPREIYVQDNFYNQSQSAFVSTVGSKLDARITNINVVSELERRYDEGEHVYFRTDRNWTSLGAYSAYKAFCSTAGISAYPIESFVQKDGGEFLGSFYNATSSIELEKDPDLFYYYPALSSIKCSLTVYDNDMVYSEYELCGNDFSIETAYNVYLGRDAARYEINTTAPNRSLLIIGDSSAAPLAPFLASHYSKIDIINPERFNESLTEFLRDRKYDDVLTICYSTNAVNGSYIPSFNIINGVTENE